MQSLVPLQYDIVLKVFQKIMSQNKSHP